MVAFGYALYTSDNGNQYVVKLSTHTITEGNFGIFTGSPLSSTTPFWPYHESDMRHVTGRAASGKHGRLPIGVPTDSKYVSGGNFTDSLGNSYAITGAEGERRVSNHVA